MIAEAVEAVHVLMWALAGWIVVFAAAATLLLLAGCAAVAWAWRAVRRAHEPPRPRIPHQERPQHLEPGDGRAQAPKPPINALCTRKDPS